jgi:hypothetical protein
MSEQDQELQNGEDVSAFDAAEEDSGIFTEPQAPSSRSALLLFGLLVIGGAALWLMYAKGGAKAAEAASAERTATAAQTITTFLSDGEANRKLMEQTLRNTEKVVQQFLNYPSMTQVPLSDLRANPFWHSAPKAASTAAKDEEAERKRQEAERVEILKAVRQLQLQSVMHSDRMRACMIGNTLYQEGQEVSGFTIEKINPNAVIVRNGAYRFELRMQR